MWLACIHFFKGNLKGCIVSHRLAQHPTRLNKATITNVGVYQARDGDISSLEAGRIIR